jgi:hypothetical protein|tara:strand:- start:146 stop:337 length:192 start_codon:yes stop_codon:yes gene_type:complete
MSEPTVIDAEYEELETRQVTLEDRVKELEGLVKHLLEGRVSILEQFREMIAAITEISEESSEE